MVLRAKSRFRQNCRIAFRLFRIGGLLLVLLVAGAVLYLNQVGLPGLVKNPLLQKLRDRGVDLEFSRLRWRWHRGIVAEDVHFGNTNEPVNPTLTVKEVVVRLDYVALAKLQLQVDALLLRQGCLKVPIAGTNATPRVLSLDNIQTELHLMPGDLWDLAHFRAQFANGDIQLAGTVTNASAIRNWKFFQARAPAPGTFQRRVRAWADALDQIHFTSPPHLELVVRGDARDPRSFTLQGKLSAPGADTPWGKLQQGLVRVELWPANDNEWSHAEFSLEAEAAQTPWGSGTGAQLHLSLLTAESDPQVVQARLEMAVDRLETKWGAATGMQLAGHWLHSFTNPLPLSGQIQLSLDQLQTRWGDAKETQLHCDLDASTNPIVELESSWPWWTNLAPYVLNWECHIKGLQSTRLQADEITCTGHWSAPDLDMTRIHGRLYGGTLQATSRLNVSTRLLSFSGSSDFDLQQISGLLTEKSRHWLAQYSWQKPPELEAEGTLFLPEWTNRSPDWALEVKPTVRLNGHVRVENGSFRDVPASSADGHFEYSNHVWRIPDLVVIRPEGRLDLIHQADERTRDYYFRLRSSIDVRALRPLLEPRQQHAFDLIEFSQNPVVEGEVWGRWYEHDLIGAKAHVAATNFSLRGQSADWFEADLEYTNQWLKVIEPRLERAGGAQRLAATSADVDFKSEIVYLTNGFSTAEPLVVARAIGPRIGRSVEPYRFLQPPTVKVQGIIPIRDERKADLHFDVEGGPFEWWKFKVPRIAGKVDWVKENLALGDVRADFYGGAGVGKAAFDFRQNHLAAYRFNARATDADLHLLMQDLSPRTNRLEGRLTARLDITEANPKEWQSWHGSGRVSLRDGLIWEIPIFGIFSPVLDAITPGLGSSRASEGSATFSITNGIIHSDDLEIRASMMRLQYWGMLDLKGQVDAHAEAELLRDTWVFGRFISLALWPVSKLFEYQITGTLQEPKSEPIFFVPRLVLFPLHPIRTLKDLMPETPNVTPTNGPPSVLP